MKTINEIIKEFKRSIEPKSTMEDSVKEAIPYMIEGFIEFYGEGCREEITSKISNVKIIIPPVEIDVAYGEMVSEIIKYLNKKYSINLEEYNYVSNYSIQVGKKTLFLTNFPSEVQEFYDEIDKINKLLEPFMKLEKKYSEQEEVILKICREECENELDTFMRSVLKNDLGYPEEMLKSEKYNFSDRHTFGGLKKNEFKSAFEIWEFIEKLRKIGINIPKMNIDKDPYNFSKEAFENAKIELESLISNQTISKFIPPLEVLEKIVFEFDRLNELAFSKCESILLEQFYGINARLFNDELTPYAYLLSWDKQGECVPVLIQNRFENIVESGFLIKLARESNIEEIGSILVHETNHGVEAFVISDSEEYTIQSGWDILGKVDKKNYNFNKVMKRYYELFNECINDLITLDILKNIRKNTNLPIFNKNGTNAYQNAYFVVEEFYQLYKPEIIESRKNHNIDALYQKIGYENFEALASLMYTVSEKAYSEGFDYKQAKNDLDNGIANDESTFLAHVMVERDKIINSMKEHSQSANRSRGFVSNSIIILNIILFGILSFILTLLIIK